MKADDERQETNGIGYGCPNCVPWKGYNPNKVTRFTPRYRQAPSRPGVYLFLGMGTGLVKIGYTGCVSQRIQGGLCVPGGGTVGYLADVRGGPRVEAFLHDVFRRRHAFGREWFYLTDGMLEFVRLARQNHMMTAELCPDELADDEANWAPLARSPQ